MLYHRRDVETFLNMAELTYIPIYFKHIDMLEKLSNEEVGHLLFSLLHKYTNGDEPVFSTDKEELVYSALNGEIKACLADKLNRSEYNKKHYQNRKKEKQEKEQEQEQVKDNGTHKTLFGQTVPNKYEF